MRVPVVSSQQSWRRKKARTLRRIREAVQQCLYFLTLWGRTLQRIGGKYVHFKKEMKKSHFARGNCWFCNMWRLSWLYIFAVAHDWLVRSPTRELWRRRPVLLPLPAIPGAAQFSDLPADRCLRPGAQHHLQLVFIFIFSFSFNFSERPFQQLFQRFRYWPPQSNTCLCFGDSSGCSSNVDVSQPVKRKVAQGRRSRCDAAVSRQQPRLMLLCLCSCISRGDRAASAEVLPSDIKTMELSLAHEMRLCSERYLSHQALWGLSGSRKPSNGAWPEPVLLPIIQLQNIHSLLIPPFGGTTIMLW